MGSPKNPRHISLNKDPKLGSIQDF